MPSSPSSENLQRAGPHGSPEWPPVVVASVFQTGLNLMRDLLRRGLRVEGVDCHPEHEGFRSRYGVSHLCPDPDTHPEDWVAYMIGLARSLGAKPVFIPAADQFVSALAEHAHQLKEFYLFSLDTVVVQAQLATKEKQYALAQEHGLPIPRTDYIQSRAELELWAAEARFPCLLKPRHQREWESLPAGNALRGRKLVTAPDAAALLDYYALAEAHRPEVMAQEIVAGGDDTKFCYLSVYGSGSRRLGHCVVREFRAYPIGFGSGSLVRPVVDEEIATLCDSFLRAIGYVGICEIEVKRDARDGIVRLIEANPRFSGTGDASLYTGVDIGWLHYLDLIGRQPAPVEATRFDFTHVTLRRDIPSFEQYLDRGLLTWADIRNSYRGPLEFFDFDPHDPGPTAVTLLGCVRVLAGMALRRVGLRRKLPR